MDLSGIVKSCCQLALLGLLLAPAVVAADVHEHQEFEATLDAPYRADASADRRHPESRIFTLMFDNRMADRPGDVSWRLEVLNSRNQKVQTWRGVRTVRNAPVAVRLRWAGDAAAHPLPAGVYRVHMVANLRAPQALGNAASGSKEQTWDTLIGDPPRVRTPTLVTMAAPRAIQALAHPAPGTFPYTVYLANLHSQTNHSDGGGDLASCTGAQTPQAGRFGPADAYAYARAHGLDILVASEHNHMYDGSDGTNAAADPAVAKTLFQSGLKAAADFSAAHPDFLAVYGLEWGVISGGGHLNIFNTSELLEWETNASGQLIGDTLTAKNDYAALYALMRQRGWVGQFNHPALAGQFQVNGVSLGYTADGDEAVSLCEVVNSFAFSSNTSETETRRSNYEAACDKALEAGFHVAFSSDQDNHCANWGASYSNRTGILIPAGTALTAASFLDALRARRVFATMDKNSQLVLTANENMMGERFINSGELTLTAYFANPAGRTVASVAVLQGVPGRNGTVSQLSDTAVTKITPAVGEHFYYVRLTQDDGKILWSSPVWVSQTSAAGFKPIGSPPDAGAPARDSRPMQ